MLTTIKSKITVLALALLLVLGLVVVSAAIMAFYHDKELIIAGNNVSITAFENQMNMEISTLEKEASDLAVMGEVYYQNGKQQDTGEFFTKQLLKNYPNSMGNGIWFEPYEIDNNHKSSCIHALWDELGQIVFLPSCVRGDYDYFSRNWYAEIIKDLKSGKQISWTRPYKSSEVEFLMTTVGVGIYNQNRLVGIAMVDWQMDSILKSILKIKPTPNSFVLFADKTNDYIIATTEPGLDNDAIMGKTLSDLKWYFEDLTDGVAFTYKGVKYIPYIKRLNNGLFLIVNVPLWELFHAAVHHLVVLLGLLLISTFFIVSILYWVLKRNINQPIDRLAEMARKMGRGNLNFKIHLDKPKELAGLASVLNKMTRDIKAHILRMAQISHEKEKIESELAIAHSIQDSALPKDFPKNDHFELMASMTPAREVGGDFYDFFPIDDHHYAFVMADVSGKGITAALYMMSAKAIIKNMLQARYPLSEVANKVNQGLCDNHARGMFVTAFIGILDQQTGRIDYINAGHCPPLQKTKKGYQYVDVVKNLVLGITPSYKYEIGHFILKPEDRLFLYTDGVTEAQTKDEKLYGPERLQKILNKENGSVGETLDRVHKGIARFTKGTSQSDDVTMMEIIFHKKQSH